MTPQDLRILRYQLPPFGEGAKPSNEMQAFCRFYGIDFTATRPELEHRVGYVDSGAYRLALHCWRQPQAKANLLVVHGYYDHTGLFGNLVRWGLEHNCNVVIFDLPGHGLSTGEPAVIQDFAEYGQAIADVLVRVRLPDLPLWALGQSTGCAAITEYARRTSIEGGWPFTALVFLAPLVRPAKWGVSRFFHSLLNPLLEHLPRNFTVNTSNEEFLHFQKNDPLQCRILPLAWVAALKRWLASLPRRDLGVGPVLVVQGDEDGTVDWRYNLPFVQVMYPGSEVLYLAGAGHQLANESAALREQYLLRVKAYLADRGVELGGSAQL